MIPQSITRQGRASGWLRRLANIFNRLIWTVRAYEQNLIDPFRRADPGKFLPVKLYFLGAEQLIRIDPRVDQPKAQAIGLGDVVDMVGRDDRSRARHVLHDDSRIPRNVFAEIESDEASPVVLRTAD